MIRTLIMDAIRRLEALKASPPVEEVARRIEVLLERMDQNDRRVMALVAQVEAHLGESARRAP